MIGIQLLGLVVGLAAMHLSYLYYKRASFTRRELFFWLAIWMAFVFVTVFPRSVAPVVGVLGLNRPMDLIMITAFIILFALTFHNYIVNRQQKNKLERLVRELALKDLRKYEDPRENS